DSSLFALPFSSPWIVMVFKPFYSTKKFSYSKRRACLNITGSKAFPTNKFPKLIWKSPSRSGKLSPDRGFIFFERPNSFLPKPAPPALAL
ncbi:MAG: hypothetical protein WAU10_01940, partial [Caldilineaceae bacterium]